MNHDEIQDLLEAYVDDRLDRPTRKLVDDHLKTCDECRSILDDVAPVDIAVLGVGRFDERAMRRTVRRSLFRTAANAALFLLAGAIVILFVSVLVIQPFIINRGDRAVETGRAAIDLTSMANPGAVLLRGEIQSGILSRELSLDFAIPVGGSWQELGTKSYRIGMFAIHGSDGGGLWPFFETDQMPVGDPVDTLARLGDGTVATVALQYDDPLTIEEAQRVADDVGYDVRVVWAGFDVTRGRNEFLPWSAGGALGYGTCQTQDRFYLEALGGTSASFSQGIGSGTASISAALESVIDGLANIAGQPDIVSSLQFASPDTAQLDDILVALRSEPAVRMLVVTGPSSEVSRFLEDNARPSLNSQILAIDFYNWTSGVCGR